MLAVLLADTAHERARGAGLLQADKLDGVHLVLGTQRLLVGFIRQRYAPVLGEGARGVRELGALGAQVRGTHRAVHGGSVTLVLIAADDALGDMNAK